MVRRCKHPNKEVEGAIKYAEKNGWVYKDSGGSSHAWGRLYCPLHTREGHTISIWSTPRSPYAHAKLIKAAVDKCHHEVKERGALCSHMNLH